MPSPVAACALGVIVPAARRPVPGAGGQPPPAPKAAPHDATGRRARCGPGLRSSSNGPASTRAASRSSTECTDNPEIKLIVIDTWKKICPRRRKTRRLRARNRAAGLLQKLAAKHQIAIIIIHHSRKGTGSEDFVDDVLGSTGLTGAVDTIIGFRRKRGTSDAEISLAGRDVDECEKALAGDHTTGLWRMLRRGRRPSPQPPAQGDPRSAQGPQDPQRQGDSRNNRRALRRHTHDARPHGRHRRPQKGRNRLLFVT